MTLRVAVSGVKATPPLFDTIQCLGKEIAVRRLNKSIKRL